jgi:clan AA aspartic protease
MEVTVDAVIDTGFTGDLTLPASLIRQLGLSWLINHEVILGDGSVRLIDVYGALVRWDGRTHGIPVDEAETDPLVGMSLLNGFELRMQVRPGGAVTITALT